MFLLKQKYDVESTFKQFNQMIKTQILIPHIDNGSEYFNSILGQCLIKCGIFHQSCVGKPQQHRVAKRKNHHLLEIARPLCLLTMFPNFFGEKLS